MPRSPGRPPVRVSRRSRRFVAATETALAELLTADLSGLDLVAFMVDGVHFADSCCVVALTDHAGRHEGAVVAGRGLDGERDAGHRADRRSAGAWAGRHPAGAGGPGRVQGAAPGGAGRVRLPGAGSLPAPQDPQRPGQAPAAAAPHRGAPDVRGLPRRDGTAGRGSADRAGPRAGHHAPVRGHEPARGPTGDPDRPSPGVAADPDPDLAVHERSRA